MTSSGTNKYIENLGFKAEEIEKDVNKLTLDRNELKSTIKKLSDEIQQKYETGKIADQLEVHRTNKNFIKEIADFAKIKLEYESEKESEDDETESKINKSSQNLLEYPDKNSDRGSRRDRNSSILSPGMFITQGQQIEKARSNAIRMQKKLEEKVLEKEKKREESCFEIPFNSKTGGKFQSDKPSNLMDILTEIQESNLAMMNRIQEDDNNLEELQKSLKEEERYKLDEISTVTKNLEDVEQAMQSLKKREKQMIQNLNIKIK